jgi:DNA polymerase-3 subunit gamma/tau
MAKSKPTPPPDPAADAGYTVVARRYRPQQFADLVGQEHVAAALSNAIATGRIAHAYLFTGARGTGKTSTARILAKALNCERGPTATPCDACDICRSVAAGDDVDVVEIDAASNTGVENIRELRGNVGFRPQRARFKVYIIDEVHMLSTSAFNALLKTLEEPPAHVKFIFATTEAQKIPVTILSRCQRFDFAHIGAAKVFETLKHIVHKEGVPADDDALRLIARRAAGSMRDAQTLLDQLLGSATGALTADAVHALLGTAGDERVGELAEAILAGDANKALSAIADAADRGAQLGELADQLVDYWRGLMLMAVAGAGAADLPGTPALQERIRQHAKSISLDGVLSGIDVLASAKGKMRGSPHAQVLLEAAVVRLARMGELLAVSELAKLVSGGGAVPTTAAKQVVGSPGPRGNGVSNYDTSKKTALTRPEPQNGLSGLPQPVAPQGQNGATPLTSETLSVLWERILQEVGPVRGNHLRLANLPAIIGPNTLAIRFPLDYTVAYDACANETGTRAIQTAIRRVTGSDWAVRFEKRAAAEGQVAPASPAAPPVESKKDVRQLPLFRHASELLGAQLMKVDDGFAPTAPVAFGGPSPNPAPEPEPDEV